MILNIKVTPNSSITKIVGKFLDEKNQQYLKVNLAAVPEDGKANEELIKFLSKTLKISKSKIEIIRGTTSRIKAVKINLETSSLIQNIEDFLLKAPSLNS